MAELTRRNFLLGAGVAGAALAMTAAGGRAYAADKKDEADEDWASQVTEEISCDILIIGGGFSGTAAAVQAGENGDKVLLIEGQSALGGNGTGVELSLIHICEFGRDPGPFDDRPRGAGARQADSVR